MLEDDNRVVRADCGGEQALRVVGGGRGDDGKAGRVCKQHLDALGVIQPPPHTAAVGHTNGHRCRLHAVGAVADPRRLADELVYCRPNEIGKLDFSKRPHAVHGGSQRKSTYERFGQRCVDHTILAELLYKAVGRKENPAPKPDVFTEQDHAFIAAHLGPHGVPDRLDNRLFGHQEPPSSRLLVT